VAASKNLTPEQRTQRARIAADASWARTEDPAARTAPAQQAARDRFERGIREEFPGLSDEQYARMAEHARRAYFTRLAFESSKARTRRADARRGA
jgi:hypothetical protein